MYIACTIVYNIKKKKKKSDLLPLGSLFLMGLNSTRSSYSQIRSEKRGGGGNLGRLPDYQLVLAFPWPLGGHLTLGQLGLLNFVLFMSSLESLVTYPPTKR